MSRTGTHQEIFNAFVSMPYGEEETDARRYWNDFYSAILDMRPLFDSAPYTINFMRPAGTVGHLELKQNVIQIIDESHLVVAVITGLNPNVFWEVGYAECQSKPVVFLVEKHTEEARTSPVLVNATLRLPYDGTIFDEALPDGSQVRDFQMRLLPFLKTAVRIVKGQKKEPQYSIFNDREEVSLAGVVARAQKSIDLITSNLIYFADTSSFTAAVGGEQKFAFDFPVERGVRVRILALDPDSFVAGYRAKQLGLGYDVASYREELRNSAAFFYQRYRNYRNVQILIYDDLPLQITLLIDNEVITSIMSRGNRSRYNIHAQFDLDFPGVRDSFGGHFAEVLANQAQTRHISYFAWAQTPATNADLNLTRRNAT